MTDSSPPKPPIAEEAERILSLEATNGQSTHSTAETAVVDLSRFKISKETEKLPSERKGEATHTPSEAAATVPPLPKTVPDLARKQDILAAFLEEIHRAGVVGEDRLVATTYLAITSRLLDKPVSLIVKGASSSGKSHITQRVIDFFPSRAVLPFTGMSQRALVLSQRNFQHRTVVIFEATALRERAERQSGDQTAYFIRTLVSEGRTHYEMSVRAKDGNWTTRRFEKEGPTNVIVTTTALTLHNENETRMLSIPTNDSPEQTRNVLLSLAEEDDRDRLDLTPWRELQDWLFAQDSCVVHIPFGRHLAENIPPVAVRLRRDFGSVLSLIRAHAVLHQFNRERDAKGRILATPDDYRAVRDLILDVVSEGIGATVSPTIREVVGIIKEVVPEEVTAADVGRKLGLDKSAARRRLQAATSAGYIVNREERRGRPGRYVLGDPLPEELVTLPSLPPDHLDPEEPAGQASGGTVASDPEGVEAEEQVEEETEQDELGETVAQIAQEMGYPRLKWDAVHTVLPGEENWRKSLMSADETQLVAVFEALKGLDHGA